ncbi:UNVERIFIED_CONTAM: hypothetical protein Slati_3960400 [Sesamum latifolium]|uniref:Uncharacterized protein n=1 Tax=Sesamum latifolium TaxID=2727402 RepID=A0AAW2TNG0_9LAMI
MNSDDSVQARRPETELNTASTWDRTVAPVEGSTIEKISGKNITHPISQCLDVVELSSIQENPSDGSVTEKQVGEGVEGQDLVVVPVLFIAEGNQCERGVDGDMGVEGGLVR